MKQKGQSPILIIVGILVVGLIGGAYYLGTQKSQNQTPVATQTPQPSTPPDASPAPTGAGETANWKTYNNITPGWGFSIKYPSNLIIEMDSNFKRYGLNFMGIFLRNYPAEVEYMKADAISISLHVAIVQEPIDDLKTWFEKASVSERVDGTIGPDVRNFTTYKLGDIDAVTFQSGGERIWKNVAFYKEHSLFKENYLYLFVLNPTGETGSSYKDNKDAEPLFDQILATFGKPIFGRPQF